MSEEYINHIMNCEECKKWNCVIDGHEYESIETITSEIDFYGEKYLVLYRCVHCNKEIEEWQREK
ncbi:MAG: hypothetical protein ACXWFC_12995 [Nitrososphaeraceae archaeon]